MCTVAHLEDRRRIHVIVGAVFAGMPMSMAMVWSRCLLRSWSALLLFAAHVRGVTKSAIPLKFPFGHMEGMERMTPDERDALQEAMRELYAVHYTELMERSEGVDEANSGGGSMAGNQGDPDNPDTDPANEW